MSNADVVRGESPSLPKRELPIALPKFFDNGSWRDHAKCVGMTDIFFPRQGISKDSRRENVRMAQAVCAECSVRKECFNFAKRNDEVDGVWGGIDFYKPRNGGKGARDIPDSID